PFQLGHFVIMGGKERPCAKPRRILDVFCDRPGDAEAIVGAGPSSDFIEQDQAPSGGAIHNMGSFNHLDHKGALSSREVVGGPDASENSIDQTDPCFRGRNETAYLCKERDQADLAEIGTLPGHVRSGQNYKPIAIQIEQRVVWYEIQVAAELFNNRVSTLPNHQSTGVVEDRFDISIQSGSLSQTGQDV